MASYLTKKPTRSWINATNQWIQAIDSQLPPLLTDQSLLSLIEEVVPVSFARSGLFSTSLRIKLDILILLLFNYEETSLYGRIIKIYDPKGIFQ
jgi:hypothetical protein